MNDFTKEELHSLVSNILTVQVYTEIDNYDEDLLEKIELMLDNYCEHKETVNIGGWVSKCVKCGTKFGDETQ